MNCPQVFWKIDVLKLLENSQGSTCWLSAIFGKLLKRTGWYSVPCQIFQKHYILDVWQISDMSLKEFNQRLFFENFPKIPEQLVLGRLLGGRLLL